MRLAPNKLRLCVEKQVLSDRQGGSDNEMSRTAATCVVHTTAELILQEPVSAEDTKCLPGSLADDMLAVRRLGSLLGTRAEVLDSLFQNPQCLRSRAVIVFGLVVCRSPQYGDRIR